MSVPSLDPELLRAFLAVAEHRSFTRAAAALHRTQSALSMQIKRLEDRLGAVLLHRNRAHVVLAPAGEDLMDYARRIVALNEEAFGRLAARRLEGVVRLGVMDDYGTRLLPSLLAAFARCYPAVQVEMETGLTARMAERLGAAFDLVIAMHQKGQGGGVLLRHERALWAAAPSWRAAPDEPLPLALYPQGCLFREWATRALDAARRPWRLAYVSHSLAAVEAIAAEGLAVTVMKASTFPQALRRLDESEGLPSLPDADIRLHSAPSLGKPAAVMAEYLREGLGAAMTGRGSRPGLGPQEALVIRA